MTLAARALDALGNPTRREILDLLRPAPLSVGELADRLPISRPAVSRHLRLLQEAGLVATVAEGRHHMLHLQPDGIAAVQAWIAGFWDEALPRFALVAENLGAQTQQAPPGQSR